MGKPNKLICIKQCNNCGKNVEIRNKERLNRLHVFCSKQCEMAYKKIHREKAENYFNCKCPICGKLFHLKPYRIKKYKNNYCSKECHRLAKMQYMKGEKNHQFGLKGNKNSSWKSDRKITNYGYIKIRCLDHPFKDCDGFVFEHRLVAEKYLLNDENSIEIDGKRYLKPEYDVHHLDKNRLNNNLNNLEVITKKKHCELHIQERLKKQCKPVDKFNINGNYIESYQSIKEAGEKNKIFPQNINKCCKGKQKTAGGFIWKYKKEE